MIKAWYNLKGIYCAIIYITLDLWSQIVSESCHIWIWWNCCVNWYCWWKQALINCFLDLNLRSWVTRLLTWLLRLGFYYPGVEPWGWNANPVETVGHYNAGRDEVTFGAKLERSPCWLFVSKTPTYIQISSSNLTTGISSFIHSWMLFFSDWQVQQMYSGVAAQEVRDHGVVETTQPNMVSD